MASAADRPYRRGIHPVHAVLLASILPLFLGALLSDWAYSATFQIQWTNFASWLIAGALFVGAFAVLWALIDLLRKDSGARRPRLLYFAVLLAAWVLGFVNALVHAMDGWATMPEGLVLSVIVAILAVAAVWLGFAASREGDVR